MILELEKPGVELAYIDPPSPCPNCGGLMLWWDVAGRVHCLDCHPPAKSREILAASDRILSDRA